MEEKYGKNGLARYSTAGCGATSDREQDEFVASPEPELQERERILEPEPQNQRRDYSQVLATLGQQQGLHMTKSGFISV